jgi:hypothetical protein
MNHRLLAAAVALLATLSLAPAAGAEPGPPDVRHVQMSSYDATRMDGWLHMPTGARPERVPTVLMTGPYWGESTTSNPTVPTGADRAGMLRWIPIQRLVDEGFAVAVFNVRGTGNSGGCFDFWGAREERDQEVLVNWLAAQPWSNGRVGMIGLSYMAATAVEAAVRAPKALKAIVVTGTMNNVTWLNQTPQGAVEPDLPAYHLAFPATVTHPAVGGGAAHAAEGLPVTPERLCPEVARHAAMSSRELATVDRDAAYYAERDRRARLRNVKAAVAIGHGFLDNTAHLWQEDHLWELLPKGLPKWQIEGQWGHDWPGLFGQATPSRWENDVVEWFEHYLDGGPAPRRLGKVDYQDMSGAWHASTAWPPAGATDTPLHLTAGGLTKSPGGPATTVRSIPTYVGHDDSEVNFGAGPDQPVCEDGLRELYATEPLAHDLLIAGNPTAELRITSDSDSGLIGLHVYDLGPDFGCDGPVHRGSLRLLSFGAADLRFHAGNHEPIPFPVGTAQTIRLDLSNQAALVAKGHRLAVSVSYPRDRTGRYAPATFTIDPASSVTLPVVSAGGS